MNKRTLFLTSMTLFLSCTSLVGCKKTNKTSSPSVDPEPSGGETVNISLWVGYDTADFYKNKIAEYIKSTKANISVTVTGTDIGTVGGSMIGDNTACADIVTIAHDNIGRLSQAEYIVPIIDEGLLKQINEDNPESFVKAASNYFGEDAAKVQDPDLYYTFGVPYISQTLFLYYDTRYVNSEQAKTFEGLELAAKDYDSKHGADGTRSFLVTGTDGYNFSFPVLARRDPDGENIPTSRIYENFDKEACYEQSNDQVAIMRWLQRSYNSVNGMALPSNVRRWDTMIQNHEVLSFIGGSWQYKALVDAIGEENIGCAPIPTFTLAEADVEGIEDVYYPNADYIPEELRGTVDKAPVAGTTYHGGTFTDFKCFVINSNFLNKYSGQERSIAYNKVCDLLKYLSSIDIQKDSFRETGTVPAFENAERFVENFRPTETLSENVVNMARAQLAMMDFGMPQPFVNTKLNTYYYSMNGPDYYLNGVCNTPKEKYYNSSSILGIRRVLFAMEYIWRNGGRNSIPQPYQLPAASDKAE